MNLSTKVLGTTTVKRLSDRLTRPVLKIGSDSFTLHDLAAVDCFNFVAARNLDQIVNAELMVRNTRDLFDNVSPQSLAVPYMGAITFAVLGAAFESKGLGGSTPLEAWVTRHHDPKVRREFVTIATLKHHQRRDLEAAQKERRAKKRRAAARRDQAHRLRVDRFTERQNGSES